MGVNPHVVLTTREETILCIPQRPPFVAVHEIVQASEEMAETQLTILPDSIFVTNEKFSEAGLIENMAQTAAAQMGFVCRSKGMQPPVGYIASVKDLEINFLPDVGAVLRTSIVITNRVMDVVLFKAAVKSEDCVVCECEMRVFIKAVN